MDRLTALKLQNSVDNSIRALALRAAVSNLPRPIPGAPMTKEVVEAYSSISRLLIPRVLHQGQLIPSQTREEYEANYELSAENIDVIIEVLTCFGSMLVPPEIEAIETALLVILENRKSNSVVKKRAVVALSLLAVYLPDAPLSLLVQRISKSLSSGKLTPVNRRLFVTIMGSMARSIPARFGRHLPELVPFILRALSEEELQAHNEQVKEGGEAEPEFDEIREAALVALEAFLASCPQQMRPYTDEILQASLRYLKYDPNYVAEDDEEMDVDDSDADEEDEEEEDDEFGDDAGFDDDDDTSWKVRRCAAKVLYTLISTRGSGDLLDNGVLYSQAAPVLIKRFDEREENVRLEILSTMAQLVRKTGEDVILPPTSDDIPELFQQQPQSRKRRRQSSTGALPRGLSFSESSGGVTSPVLEKIPSSGPRADLARITPSIVRGLTKLLKGKLIPTKQASISLLDDLVLVQRGGLSAHLGQLIDVVIDAVKPSSGSSALSSTASVGGQASATVTTLRVAALRLISDIARTHSSATLRPHLSKIVAVVVTAANDRFYKLSAEAIRTAEEVTKMITPPRSQSSLQDYQPELLKLYNVVMERTASIDADLEVRQRAIHALGTLLARTSNKAGVTLLTDAMRRAAFDQLVERLKNETTRMAAVKAVDNVAAFADSSVKPAPAWVREVALELSAQLRKANRSIRGASAQALKHLVLSPATKGSFDPPTIKGIVEALVPVVVSNDSHLLGPAVVVLAELISVTPDLVVTPQVIAALCEVIKTSVAGSILDAILVFVNNAGQAGMARPLMASLLHDVSVSGDSSVVGKIIGQLLVAGGSNVGVTLDSFIKEAETAKDAPRAILALSVLGEAGMRLGPQSPLKPENFLSQFKEQPDKVSSAAAVALGRAGAGNVSVYLPVILNAMASGGTKQYLLLQSIREILQQVTVSNTDIGAFSQDIWTQLVNASQSEDNKAMCAECIGRLAIVDPNKFMPMLKVRLEGRLPSPVGEFEMLTVRIATSARPVSHPPSSCGSVDSIHAAGE